jgi:hypothetical protein
MQLSYLLLFFWLLIILMALFASKSHVLKSALSCLIASGAVTLYIYIEKSFPNLTSFSVVVHFIVNLLSKFLSGRNLAESDQLLIGQAIYIAALFFVFYLISWIVLSVFAFGKAPKAKENWTTKLAGSLAYMVLWGFASAFLLTCISPLFSFQLGFLSPVFNFLKWSLV